MTDEAEQEMDTSNKFIIGGRGHNLVFIRPVPQEISNDDAVNLAAWLIVLTGAQEEILKLVEEIEKI